MAKYELAQVGNLHLTIEAENDKEYFEKVNDWESIIEEKLAGIGIEFSWDWNSSKDYNPEGKIYDYDTEEWISFKEYYKREYGGK